MSPAERLAEIYEIAEGRYTGATDAGPEEKAWGRVEGLAHGEEPSLWKQLLDSIRVIRRYEFGVFMACPGCTYWWNDMLPVNLPGDIPYEVRVCECGNLYRMEEDG